MDYTVPMTKKLLILFVLALALAIPAQATDPNGVLPEPPLGTKVGHCVVFEWHGSLSPVVSPWLFSESVQANARCLLGVRSAQTPLAHVYYSLVCTGGAFDGFSDQRVPALAGGADPSKMWGIIHECTSVARSTTRPNTDHWWLL